MRLYAVFHELGDGLQRVVLGQGDDGDGVPVIADSKLAAVRSFSGSRAAGFFPAGLLLGCLVFGRAAATGAAFLHLCHLAIIVQTGRLDNTEVMQVHPNDLIIPAVVSNMRG
jgi:hypothetical protein